MYWDGEKSPSVEVPLGDFFLCGQGIVRHIRTAYVTVNTGTAGSGSHGFNCYLPMPFGKGARVTLENQGKWDTGSFWYHIEHESYDAALPLTSAACMPPGAGRPKRSPLSIQK